MTAAFNSHRTTDDRPARVALAIGVPVAMALVAYVPFLLVRSELPDPVASHFDLGGQPNGSMSIGAFLVVTGALIAIGAGICIVTAFRQPTDGALASTGGFLGGFLGGTGAGIVAATSITQRGLSDWRDADGLGWLILVTIVVGAALGALGARFASRLDTGAHRPPATPPAMQLAEGEEAVWVATARSTSMLLGGWAGVVVGATIAVLSSWPVGLIVIAASVPIIMLSTFRVRADRRGLRIRYGCLPWPATTVDVTSIERATEIDVRPIEWGGWGYRGSLKLMRRAALVHRAGPGIRLDLVEGRVFVVTVDNPGAAVALLNAQVERCGTTT